MQTTFEYKHTQTGYVVIAAVCATIALLCLSIISFGSHPVIIFVIAILVFCLAFFHSITVKVNENRVEARFGPGLFRKKIAINDIRSCKAVKNHWYYGWGVRLTPHGWLYNVSGLDAVEFEMKNGSKCRIGTDEPDKLCECVKKLIKK